VPLPAGRHGASNLHFAFGPESFRLAREMVARTANGAAAAGWWHSHPPCEKCPSQPACTADTVFFSLDDVRVHASAFQSAHMVGLVAGKVRDRPATDPGFRLFGWHNGTMVQRSLVPGGHDDRAPMRVIDARQERME
jgi:hypothetical protein